ncbi:MAG: flagellar biosynthesis anti-sigma factor FlgM [Methylococcales bacterium]|jgi:negative regulator of flagellin synthesis FlgM|nr:flagellar biosynthesis anti-sigma factor FlgM [Methylococcales bacterium]
MAIERIKNTGAASVPVKTPAKSESSASLSFQSLIKKSLTENSATQTTPVADIKATLATDSVVLTNSVQEIKKSFESFPESSLDMQRIERIKQAIENGTYEINPDRIAQKMIQFEFSQGQSNGT